MIINEEVPSRQSAQRFSQPWANRDVRRITRQKRRWFRRARRTNSQSDWKRYKDIKRRAQLTCRKAHDNHVSSMLSEDHDNPKVFWQFIKSRKKDNFGVSPLRKDGLTYNSSKQKADILNDQFTSVFTKEDLSNPPKLPKRHIPTLSQITVTVRGVFKLLQGLKPHKAAGPDKVPTRLREFHNKVPPEKVSLLCRKFCVINKPFTECIVYFCLQDICLPEKMIYDKHIHVRFPTLANIA